MVNLPSHLTIKNRHLMIGECDTVTLAEKFGTPLYVTSQARIQQNYQAYVTALSAHYSDIRVLYAAKANGNLSILKILAKEGAGADVFSSGELILALKAGLKPEHLLFNGSSKTEEDHRLSIEKGIKVSLDSIDELLQLDQIAGEYQKVAQVSFRVNPAIDVPTHPKIATGLASSKFGIPFGQIIEAYKTAASCSYIVPVGIHCHIGSQILAVEPFAKEAEVLMMIVKELYKLGIKLRFVDLGGGLGIVYNHNSDQAPTAKAYADAVIPVCAATFDELGIRPEIWIEPGRSLVGDSTILLTRVNSVKTAHKTFVNVDAGFNTLIRPAMYDSHHDLIVANRADALPSHTYSVTGPICETGDILAHDRLMPEVKPKDLIAVLDTGAYGYAMASQYNGRGRCAEVLVYGKQAELIRRAETIEDLMGTLVSPSWLKS